ncbi:NurA domain-containing protein [Salinarchaeum sp. Harcht-Bsk1]|uniref:DNA double-strand break repair nuclease NurA n=1 Tax=Salinarchaeum sp. Harcht-Bsk1 TaxID=1333523 RepID=UPI0003422D88|nr:DNA double-strand break repair nuclease NurA [Salinarchaeum sp. Harcht-Bsk1]AGN00980.1 NurA domain-containing protein [Salinarchaeum sp. Harcht-Bsk1]
MTLDRVHFRGIARHARRISRGIDEREHQRFAETVWKEFLDPLRDDDGRAVLRPLDDQELREIDLEVAALRDPVFETAHGLDSGTINPTSYKNGLVLDVAQAAMAAEPSDLDLHRQRSLITTVHSGDLASVEEIEERLDEGNTHSQLLRAPQVPRFEESVVHELSLYLAESQHALAHFDAVEDLLVLDGPIYPKGMLNWADRAPELRDLLYDEPEPRDVIENYVHLVERAVDREVPVIGFVKNPATKAITRTLRERGEQAPWVGDTALFTRLLERGEFVETVDEHGETHRERRRDTDALTYTSWFRSRGGADRLLAGNGDPGTGTTDPGAFGIDRELDPEAYEVTFFALYDPRDDLLYRIEAPLALTEDEDCRSALTDFVLREVAAERGPPTAVAKADSLARIGQRSTNDLRDALAEAFGTDRMRDYDDRRWGGEVG